MRSENRAESPGDLFSCPKRFEQLGAFPERKDLRDESVKVPSLDGEDAILIGIAPAFRDQEVKFGIEADRGAFRLVHVEMERVEAPLGLETEPLRYLVARARPVLGKDTKFVDARATKESLAVPKMIVADQIEGPQPEDEAVAVDLARAPFPIRPLINDLDGAAVGDGKTEGLDALDLAIACGLFANNDALIPRSVCTDLRDCRPERFRKGRDARLSRIMRCGDKERVLALAQTKRREEAFARFDDIARLGLERRLLDVADRQTELSDRFFIALKFSLCALDIRALIVWECRRDLVEGDGAFGLEKKLCDREDPLNRLHYRSISPRSMAFMSSSAPPMSMPL